MKNFIVGSVIIGLCIVVGFAFFGGKTVIEYGASAGPDHYNQEYFLAGLVAGGVAENLTATSSMTLTAKQVCESSVVVNALIVGNSTSSVTLPTAASITSFCLPRNGDSRAFLYRNTMSAASTTVVLAGTGVTLLEPDGQNVIIAGGNSVWVRMVRATSGVVTISIDELIDAD